MKHLILKTLIAVLTLSVLIAPAALAANPASFSMAPSTSSVVKGKSFTVSVYENGDSVNAVTTKLAFNASQIQFVGASCGAKFASTIQESNGVTCFTAGGTSLTGTQLAMVATFKNLVDSGSAVISIASGSKIVSSESNTNIWTGAPTSTGITLVAPAPSTPSTPAPSDKPSPASSPTKDNQDVPSQAQDTTPAQTKKDESTDDTVKESDTAVRSATNSVNTATVPSKTQPLLTLLLNLLPLLAFAFLVFLLYTAPTLITAIKKSKRFASLRTFFTRKP